MTDRTPARTPERAKSQDRKEQPPTWRNTRPRGNQELHERDHARSVERFEAVLGASVARVLALLYDIHGNLPALEAVLADAEGAGADRFLLGGDYAAFGAWPAETVARLRGLDASWLRGNVDRWTLDPADAPEPVRGLLERCRELLGEDAASELAGLPGQVEDGDVLYVHASPLSDVRSFMPAPGDTDEELIAAVRPRRLVFGHTHLQFDRSGPHGIELLNPGSVGMPFDGDHRAAYALVQDDGTVERRRVAYDHSASAGAVRKVLGDAGELPARRIEQARFDAA